MGQTLTNGIYLPDEGERNSYSGLEANWRTLDALILTVNGKAAPNIANTWTAAQTFTAGIAGDLTGNVTGNVTGDLTGTASKAIADEDGTNIKTGYVNVAGNQTVSGQKTWSGNQFFTSPMWSKNTTYEIGNTPASNVVIPIYFTDKNNVYTGYARSTVYTSGRTATEIRAKNTFKSGVLDPTGADISSNLNVEVQPNGTKTIYWDGLIRNDVTPFTTNNNALGSSTNQWSSVYAQTYYYNGTAWGLDKDNVWTGSNTYTNAILSKVDSSTLASFKDIYQCQNEAGSRVATVRVTHSNSSRILSINVHDNNNSAPKGIAISNDGNNNINLSATGTTNSLGSSTNKWKTLNGVNPGALSFPARDYVLSMDIDTTDWDLTGTTFYYTPIIDGWLQISISPNNNYAYIAVEYATLRHNCENTTGRSAMLTVPVVANKRYDIIIIGSTVARARLAPAQGNV